MRPHLLLSVLVLLPACASDPCRSLCSDLTSTMAGCLDDWGYTWEDLGADSRSQYKASCLADWETTRANLETRQVSDAEDRCQTSVDTLGTLDCATLYELYFAQP